MAVKSADQARSVMSGAFEIHIAEELNPASVDQWTGWTIAPHPDGGSALRCSTQVEQRVLLTQLERIDALGLTLLGIRRIADRDDGEATDGPPVIGLLREQGTLYHNIFEALSDGMVLRDTTGRILDVNEAYCRMHGYVREEMIGWTPSGFREPDDRRRFAAYIETVGAGKVYHGTGRNIRRDGTRFPVEVLGLPITASGKRYILGVVRDTTEQVRTFEQAEQRADDRSRELAALLEVAEQVTSALDLGPLLRVVLGQLRIIFDYAGASVFLREGTDQMALMLYEGPIPDAQLPTQWSIGPPRPERTPLTELIMEAEQADPAAFGREVIYSGEPVIIPDVAADTPLARAYRSRLMELLHDEVPNYIGCWMGVPLIYRDEVIGMVDFDHERPGAYTEHHARLAIAAANQATIAIVHARLLAERQSLAVQEERQRLARELHDAVTQQLFSASLIGEVLPQIWAANPTSAEAYLADLRLLTRGALAEMRALLVELRPTAITDTPLPELLQHLTSALGGRARIQVELEVVGGGQLPDDVQVALYRVTQEALNNIVKHARAGRVLVALQLAPSAATLKVRDDGRGFEPGSVPADHFGLAIMHERMVAVGGTLNVTSRPGQGTTLTAHWTST